MLKFFDIETFELNGIIYLHDVKEMKFEKYDNKHIKLITERKLLNFREKFQYKNIKINKDAPNHKEIKSLFFKMLEVYDDVQKVHKVEQFLNDAIEDNTTNEVFKIIKPECPYTFSEIISDKTSKTEFGRWISKNIWNK